MREGRETDERLAGLDRTSVRTGADGGKSDGHPEARRGNGDAWPGEKERGLRI